MGQSGGGNGAHISFDNASTPATTPGSGGGGGSAGWAGGSSGMQGIVVIRVMDTSTLTGVTLDKTSMLRTATGWNTAPQILSVKAGTVEVPSDGYTATWDKSITGAGVYTLTVTGKSPYTGTVTATYTVSKEQIVVPKDYTCQATGSGILLHQKLGIAHITQGPHYNCEQHAPGEYTSCVKVQDAEKDLYEIVGSEIKSGQTVPCWHVTWTITAKPITITFDDQGGTGGPGSSSTSAGGTMDTPIAIPTKSGYSFLGYFTAVTGGTQYYKADGTRVREWWNLSGDTTLYAQWKESTIYVDKPQQGTPTSWVYDATNHKPVFAENVCYTITYSTADGTPTDSWVNAGCYKVTFTLNPNCAWNGGDTDPVVFDYSITKPISDVTITDLKWWWDNYPHQPTVTDGGRTLVYDVDFTAVVTNEAFQTPCDYTNIVGSATTYDCTLTGNGCYTGTTNFTFTLARPTLKWTDTCGTNLDGVGKWNEDWKKPEGEGYSNSGDAYDWSYGHYPRSSMQKAELSAASGKSLELDLDGQEYWAYHLYDASAGKVVMKNGILKLSATSAISGSGEHVYQNMRFTSAITALACLYPSGPSTVVTLSGCAFPKDPKDTMVFTIGFLSYSAGIDGTFRIADGLTALGTGVYFGTSYSGSNRCGLTVTNGWLVASNEGSDIAPSVGLQQLALNLALGDRNTVSDANALIDLNGTMRLNKGSTLTVDAGRKDCGTYKLIRVTGVGTGADCLTFADLIANPTVTNVLEGKGAQLVVVTDGDKETGIDLVIRTKVAKPTVTTSFIYDETEKTAGGVATGYTVTGDKATNVGRYEFVATLADGYCWSDGAIAPYHVDWSIKAQVTFDANGGSGVSPATLDVLPGDDLGCVAVPTMDGHVFAGYFTAQTGGVRYYDADGKGVKASDFTENATLYAHWANNSLAGAKVILTPSAATKATYTAYETVKVTVVIDGEVVAEKKTFAQLSEMGINAAWGQTPTATVGTYPLNLTPKSGGSTTFTGSTSANFRVNPDAPSAVDGAALWFDAADAAKLTLSKEAITTDEAALGAGVTFVSDWAKNLGGVDHMSALTKTGDNKRKGNRPYLGTMDNGNHYVDFGSVYNLSKAEPMKSGYGAGFGWFDENGAATNKTGIMDVYMVVMDDAGCNARYSGSCQYQHFLGSSSDVAGSSSFYRLKDYGYIFIDKYIGASTADAFIDGIISVDGKEVDCRTLYPSGFHVLRFASSGKAGDASALCSNKLDAQGGLKYGELIVFDEVQSDANATAIIDYLYRKWLGDAPKNDILIQFDNGEDASEKLTNGFLMARHAVRTQDIPIKYIDSSVVGYTFQGYFETPTGGTQYYNYDGTPCDDTNATCPFEADTTVYAVWTGNVYTVALDADGGSGGTSAVRASYGSPMPAATMPTKAGFEFDGYYYDGWYVTQMLGLKADVVKDGTLKYAYAPEATTVNGVAFTATLAGGVTTMGNLGVDVAFDGTDDSCKGEGEDHAYQLLMTNRIYVASGASALTRTLALGGLTAGKSYLVQVIAHKNQGTAPKLSVDSSAEYSLTQFGWSFVRRFVAASSTQEVVLRAPAGSDLMFNAIQVRELGDARYYDETGASAQSWNMAKDTTLKAHWMERYEITYDGLEGATHENPAQYTAKSEIVLRAPTKRDGYVFGGWRENGTPISYIPKNTMGNKTLTATWVSTNAYQLIEYIATTNCQFLDTGVTPRNAHFGFALDFWDQCYVRWGETDSPYISPDATSNLAKIMGTATNHRGVGQFSGFCFGNWNRQQDRNGQLVLCCDYHASSESINPMLKSDSRLRVKMVNDYNPTGCTPTKDTSYSKYTVKGVSPDGTEASVAETYYRHHIASGIDVYQDMPEWFAGSVYVGAMNCEDEYQNPYDLGYGKNGDKDRKNYMRFYRVTFYYDDIVLYDAIPAIDSNGHVGLLRVDGAEGELFAYSKTIQEDWTTAHPEDVGAEFATPFFKVNGNGGSPEETTIVKYVDQPALTVDQIPERDGFTLMGFTNATGRVYQLDGDNKFVDVPQDGETVFARWFASSDYELLDCLDNGSSLDTAGYVALTNFHLTGANVVELKYCVNAENDDKWQGVFWSRMPEKSYSLVLRNRNHSSGCKWQVTYGVEGATVSTYDRPIIGTDYVLRLCPTAVGNKGLLGYLDGNPVSWELYNASAMFEDEALVDTLLFAAGRIDPLVNDEPSRDVVGKMTGPALAKMYYFRVENSATDPTLRLDLVPVRKKATGVRGFYDLVSGNFYPLKTPVVFDGNGGAPSLQYVYTSKGDPMPALPNNPTRTDYGFLGYYDAETQYYDEKGMPVKACDFGEGTTTLRAHWLLTNTKARQELEEAFDSEKTGTTVEPVIVDGEIASYTVVLAQNYDQGVTLPGDLGPVTIDMNGWTIRGTNGVDGATTTVGGASLAGTDGGPAITVSDASGADVGVTAITVTEVWAEYMIIDLRLSGPESVSYEVAYSFDEATNRYNTLEYKKDKIVFRKIPHGTFTMGSPEGEVGRAKDKKEDWRNPETQHEVTLTQDYYIGLFPVTQRQWELVMGWNPSHYADDETRPVGSVTYQMIRGSGDGIDVSKLASGGSVGDDGFLAALRAKSGLGYLDLPTEAQWECAARAGTTNSTFFGDNVQNWSAEERKAKVYPYLWYSENSSGVSHGVGQVFPNPWGLYDTLGNVWEWCLDRVTCAPNDDLGTEAVTDPLRQVVGGRVPARGGKTDDNLDYSRSAARDGNSVVNRGADAATPNYGLRLAGICPVDEDNGRPAAGTSSAVIGGNGGNGYPPGKGSPAVTDTTGAKVTVTDPLTLVSDGNDGERWAYDLHVIRDEAGAPTVVVPTAWLKDAYPEAEVSESAYQAEFLKTNASGVKDWQSYVLGYGPKELATAKIVEETVQNASPDTVTIRLKDLPEESVRPETGCTVKYSLYAARTTAELLANGGTVVTNLAEEAYYKWPESTFEAPLSDLNDENPVNYYRIKVHFIFGGGGGGGGSGGYEEVMCSVPGTIKVGGSLPEGWSDAPYYDDYALLSATYPIPDEIGDDGYVHVSFRIKAKWDASYLQVYFRDADGNSISYADVNANVCDGFGDTKGEYVYFDAVYRLPKGSVAESIQFRWWDSNAVRRDRGGVSPEPQVHSADDMIIENLAVTGMGALKAAVACDNIMDESIVSSAWTDAMNAYFNPNKDEWKRNLSGLTKALNQGGEYNILVIGDSLSFDPVDGCIEALIKRQWPKSNVKFYSAWYNNTGCYQIKNNDYKFKDNWGNVERDLRDLDFTKYQCVIFAGITQARFSPNESDVTRGANAVAAVSDVRDWIAAKAPDCQFVMLSPLLSHDSRKNYTFAEDHGPNGFYDIQFYATDEKGYIYLAGTNCNVVTDWDVSKDPWAVRDYYPTQTASPSMADMCKTKGMAYWDLYKVAYDYLFRCGKPLYYYSRDAVHTNSFGKQLAARLVFEAFKIVGGASE